MYHGGGGFGGGSPFMGAGLHGGSQPRSAFDEDDVLGKVYDNRVIARLPKYLSPVKSWLALGAVGMVVRSQALTARVCLQRGACVFYF